MSLSREFKLLWLFIFTVVVNTSQAQFSKQPTRWQRDSLQAFLFFTNNAGVTTRKPFLQNVQKTKISPLKHLSFYNQQTESICYDTSSRFFVKSDSVFFYSHKPLPTSDGKLLLSGQYASLTPPYEDGGFFLKCNYDGSIIWNKLYDSSNNSNYNYFNFHKIIELADGTFFAAGYTNNQITDNDELLLMKFDTNGNIIWNKIYKSRFWTFGNGSGDYFYVQDLQQDPYTGEVYICGPHWTAGKALIKINPANGNIIWSNAYRFYGNFDIPFGLEIRQNEIRYFARIGQSINTILSLVRINKLTGDTIQIKTLKASDTAGYKVEFLSADGITIKNNGNYLLSGKCYGNWMWQWNGVTPLYQATIVETDSNFNYVKGIVFKSPIETNSYNTVVTTNPNGTGTLAYLKIYGGYSADYHFTQFDRNLQIVKQRMKFYSNGGFPFENKTIKTPDGGDMVIRLIGDSITERHKTEFLKLHSSDTSSSCLGYDNNQTFTQPVQYISDPYHYYDSTFYNVFLEMPNKTLTIYNHHTDTVPACFQVSHCDSVKITASPTITCPGQPVTIQIHKNADCGSNAPLIFDTTAIASVTQINDSTYSFVFDTTWTGRIYTSLQGCILHQDSVQLQILQAPALLSLGPDTTICPNNTIILNAHAGYASYLWQDGSTDSLFTVTQPGTYFVTTANACGGTYTDTAIVVSHPPIPITIGPDRTKCNNDSLQMQATPGFLNYGWSPAYNISSLNTQQVVVNPAIDTFYTVRAEKTPGCFAFDTVRITVHQSPSINLGADKSFCKQDSAVLNAGTGFSFYQWNNGRTTQQISVYTAGNYSVIGTTTDGCKSHDTVSVVNVFPLPVISLTTDTTLCDGVAKILDAGAGYTSYLWNNNSTGQTLTAGSLGTYKVTVIDNNGCEGTGTANITKPLPSPNRFLFTDTAICNYGTIQLKALQSYKQYIWSNGSNSPSIIISNPGIYTLEVTDNNNCIGKDSVIVNLKECLKGLYVPSGFTPNGDGKNDLLKPILLGNIKQYRFKIYSRWGHVVFETTDPAKGWNGILSGQFQDSNVFIWMCYYQLEGETAKTEKGTVVIIR